MKIYLLAFLLLFPTFLNAQPNAQTNLPSEVILGSYNLHGLRSAPQLKQDLAALNFVEVWAFQEVEGSFTERTEKAIRSILPEGTWYIHIEKVNSIDSQKGIWEGQVIASKYPIDSIEVIPLKHTDEKQRVALVANFTTTANKKFQFVNTDHEVNVFSISFKDRKKQLESLVEYFKKSNSSAVITGDFNTTGGDSEIKSTESILTKAKFVRSLSIDKDSYTFDKILIKKELDHFFSRGVESTLRYRYNDRQGSDHYPIYIKARI